MPAVSWATTYYPLYQYGLKLKFVDVDLETLNFNIEELRKAVTDKTRLILPLIFLETLMILMKLTILSKEKIYTFLKTIVNLWVVYTKINSWVQLV